MKTKQQRFYKLDEITIEEIVQHHNQQIMDDYRPLEYIEPFDSYVGCADYQAKRAKKIIKNDRILARKYEFLIHLIISRMMETQGYAQLSATILEKVFGKVYYSMLRNLLCLGLIYKDGYYDIGEKCYGYILCEGVKFSSSHIPVTEFFAYKEKLYEAMKAVRKKTRKEIETKLNDTEFLQRYEESLNQINAIYYKEAMQFINAHHFQSDFARQCYIYSLEKFTTGELNIYSIDRNKRIYTPLTSTPKILKSFLNLKYSIDIHNSHPLLFNYILFKYFKLPSNSFQEVSSLLVKYYKEESLPYNLHNVRKFLRKYLINNGINKETIKDIPIDVLEYIYLTSNGIFWDEVLKEEETTELTRSDIKVMMFAEVFYSKKLSARGKANAKTFRERFPSVYRAVLACKRKDRTGLANYMMALESKIFREILQQLYAKGYQVVNIHDAIVVPDIVTNSECTPEFVAQVIDEVYRKYNLVPNTSTDYYGEEQMKQVLEDEVLMNAQIECFMEKLKTREDEEGKELLAQINSGLYEFLLDKQKVLMLHRIRK